MADQMPEMDPAELINLQAEVLSARLIKVAADAVRQALESGTPATVSDILQILESLTQTLPSVLLAAIETELPRIAEQAVLAAEVEISEAREASGKPFPPVNPPPAGDYSGWLTTAVAALVASLKKRAQPAAQAAPAPDAGELSAEVLSELDRDIAAAVDALFDTLVARTVNQNRVEVFRANSDVVSKVKVVTIADAKRSEVCTHMNNAEFDPKRPVPTPPFHTGCRSYLRAITSVKRKPGATEKEIYRQNWAIFRRLEREGEGRADERLELRFAPSAIGTGTFSGYAITWDSMDSHKTMFAPGSIVLPQNIPILWSHDPARPVGVVVNTKEDEAGLFITAKLSTETRDGADAYQFLSDKAVTGLSIGFRRLADEAVPGGRRITRADLKEISLVTVPSNESARVVEVRSRTPAAGAASTKEKRMASSETAPAGSGTLDTRVGALETTVTEIKTAVDEIKAAVVKTEARSDRLEARSSRLPLGSGDQPANDLEKRAFGTFIRKGREALSADEVRSLRVADDTAGGYLSPDQFIAELIKNLVQYSPMRQLARVASVNSGNVILPKRTAGTTATWVGEIEDRPETQPTYGQNQYPVAELAAYSDISNTLLEDTTFDIASELTSDFAEQFGKAEATAFVNGNGVLKPAGYMNSSEIGFTVSGSGSAITADSLIQLFHDLPAAYRNAGTWVMNSQTLGAVRKLKDGSTGSFLLLTSGIGNSPSTTLLGRPVVEAIDMPDVSGGAFPIAFGDFKQGYRIFDRVQLSVLRDPYSRATNGLTRFHARRRVAGGVSKAEAIRKLKIST
jgi:HK97 family phage major capsid protein/HK97 family phage prohead protease